MENNIKQTTQKTIIFQTGIINLCINEETKGLEQRIKAIEQKLEGQENKSNIIKAPQTETSIKANKQENIDIKHTLPNTEADNRNTQSEQNEKSEQENKTNIQTKNLKSQEFWPNILQQLKANGKVMLYANLLNSRAVELNDMTIGIEFSSGLNDFRKKLLEKSENLQEVEKLVSIACGKQMQIKYIDKPVRNINTTSKGGNTTQNHKESVKEEHEAEKSNNINSLDDLKELGLEINYIDE